VSTTVCCLCMKDNDFSSHMFVSLIFCIHLNWHRACLCVLATMRCRTRSTNERHKYRERENDGVIRCSSCGTNLIPLRFFSRFLVLLLMLMRFLSLSLPDISSSYSDRPTLTYKREKVPTHTHTHTHTHSKARSCVDLQYTENDAKLSAAY